MSKCQPNSTANPKWSNYTAILAILAAPNSFLKKAPQKDPDFLKPNSNSGRLCQLCLCLEDAFPVAARPHGVVGHAGSLTSSQGFTGNNVGCHDAMVNSVKSESYPVGQGYQVDWIEWKKTEQFLFNAARIRFYMSLHVWHFWTCWETAIWTSCRSQIQNSSINVSPGMGSLPRKLNWQQKPLTPSNLSMTCQKGVLSH